MDKKKENKEENSIAREPMATYQRTYSPENVQIMSLKRALEEGMPLEESKRLIMDKIHNDFPEYKF